MTTMTDLTPERLDELEGGYTRQSELTLRNAGWAYVMCNAEDVLGLIAMAKRTEAAEREHLNQAISTQRWSERALTAECERDALRAALVTVATHAMAEHSCGDPDVVAALAQPSDADGECLLCGGTGLRLEDGVHLPCRACNGSAYAPMPTTDAGGAE